MPSIPSITAKISVAQSLNLPYVGKKIQMHPVNRILLPEEGMNLPMLSILGGLSTIVSANSYLAILQLYFGSVNAYSLLKTQITEVVNRITVVQDAITNGQGDANLQKATLAIYEGNLFFLGILASSTKTQFRYKQARDVNNPSNIFNKLIAANNLTITLPKNNGEIFKNFIRTSRGVSLFKKTSKLNSVLLSYLDVFNKLILTLAKIDAIKIALNRLRSSVSYRASQIEAGNEQIASLQETVTLLQSKLFTLSIDLIVSKSTKDNDLQSTFGVEQTKIGFLEEAKIISNDIISVLTRIQDLEATIIALASKKDDYNSIKISQYAQRITNFSKDLALQQRRLLSLMIRFRSLDIVAKNPDLATRLERFLNEESFLSEEKLLIKERLLSEERLLNEIISFAEKRIPSTDLRTSRA